jgi:hypothetical protein
MRTSFSGEGREAPAGNIETTKIKFCKVKNYEINSRTQRNS